MVSPPNPKIYHKTRLHFSIHRPSSKKIIIRCFIFNCLQLLKSQIFSFMCMVSFLLPPVGNHESRIEQKKTTKYTNLLNRNTRVETVRQGILFILSQAK